MSQSQNRVAGKHDPAPTFKWCCCHQKWIKTVSTFHMNLMLPLNEYLVAVFCKSFSTTSHLNRKMLLKCRCYTLQIKWAGFGLLDFCAHTIEYNYSTTVSHSGLCSVLISANHTQCEAVCHSLHELLCIFVRQTAPEYITYISTASILYQFSDYNKCFLAL